MILTFDIGGSRIRAAGWDGVLTPLGEVATPVGDRDAFFAAIRGLVAGRKATGLALSIAGVVDPETGIGKVANIPAISGLALGPELAGAFGVPVLVLNDADCFALAEAQVGAGQGYGTVFGVILGTGVGGGLVIDGRVVTGAGGFAGEWGHGPVIRGDHAFACGCGQVGCIDMVGGARGVERLHLALHGEAAGSEAIVARWHSGEAAAAATMALWCDLLSGPLAMVVNVVGAGILPVGGGLSRAAGVVEVLDQAVRARVLRATDKPLVVPAVCGPDAGLLGAALAGQAAWS
jgi:N-acetylglucosamine kinase